MQYPKLPYSTSSLYNHEKLNTLERKTYQLKIIRCFYLYKNLSKKVTTSLNKQPPSKIYVAVQNNLGYRYEQGQGVPQDYKKAVQYYKLAVKQGYAMAIRNLMLALLLGEGVPKNNISNYGYLLVILTLDPNDDQLKGLKKSVLNDLSSKQVEEAQAFAAKVWEDLEALKKK